MCKFCEENKKLMTSIDDEDLSLIGSKFIYINKNNEVWAMV